MYIYIKSVNNPFVKMLFFVMLKELMCIDLYWFLGYKLLVVMLLHVEIFKISLIFTA